MCRNGIFIPYSRHSTKKGCAWWKTHPTSKTQKTPTLGAELLQKWVGLLRGVWRDTFICQYCKTVQEKKSRKSNRWSLWQMQPRSFGVRSHVKPQEIKTELFPLTQKVQGCLSSLGLRAAKATPGKTRSLAGVIILFFILCSKVAQSYPLQKTELTARSPVRYLGEELRASRGACVRILCCHTLCDFGHVTPSSA